MFRSAEGKASRKKNLNLRPIIEQLEKRELLSQNVWLPQDLEPLGGSNQFNIGQHLFRPVMTDLLPQLALNTATLSIAGSFSFASEGTYGLTLAQSGAMGSNFFEFTESGTITFSLYQEGDVVLGGFDPSSMVLTQTISLDWAFREFDSGGNTVQYLSGTETFSLQTSDFERFFWVGFNWYEATQYVSDTNNLDLFDLNASSFTLQETGYESYTLTVAGAQLSFTGSGTMPLENRLGEIGLESYTHTAGVSFSLTHSGSNSFTLYEGGTYDGCYALGSVHYSEEGTAAFSYAEEGTISVNSLASASRSESSTGSNQTLISLQTSNYGSTRLTTYSQTQEGTESYSLTAAGTYDDDAFSIGSVSYSGTGTGTFALSQTLTQTDTGYFVSLSTVIREASYGANGCSTETSVALDSGAFTLSLSATLAESSTGTFARTALGSLAQSGYDLATFTRTEQASGSFTLQHTETHTQSFSGTLQFDGVYNDTSGTGSTSLGKETIATTTTYSRELSSFVSVTPTGTVQYTRSLTGSAIGGGSYSLSSYVFDSSALGGGEGDTEFDSSETMTVTEMVAGESKPLWGESAGRLMSFESGLECFLSTSSTTYYNSNSYTSPIQRDLTRATHQAGTYAPGSWSLSSLSYEQSLETTYSALIDGTALASSSGIQTLQAIQVGLISGITALGGGEFAPDTSNGTYVDLSHATVVETSVTSFADSSADEYYASSFHESSSSLRRGAFSVHSYTWSEAVFASGSERSDFHDVLLENDVTYSGMRTFAMTHDRGEWSGSCLVSGSLLTVVGQESFTESKVYDGSRTTDSVRSALQTLTGSYAAGSYTMSGIEQFEDSAATWNEVGLAVPETNGAFSWTKEMLFRGNSDSLGSGMSADAPLGTMTQQALGTYSSSSAESITKNGFDGQTLQREGTLSGGALAFGTVVQTSEQSGGGLIVVALGSDALSISLTGGFTYATRYDGGTNPLGSPSFAVATQTGFQTSSQSDSRTYNETTDYQYASSRYEAGSYSQGSYSLLSVLILDSGAQTVTGVSNSNWEESGGEVVNGNTEYGAFSLESLFSSETPGWTTGTVQSTSTSTFEGEGTGLVTSSSFQSHNSRQEGSFGSFAYSLSSVTSSESGSQTFNSVESGTRTSNTDSVISYSLTTEFAPPEAYSGSSSTNWGSATRDGLTTQSAATSDFSHETRALAESSSRYEAGAYQSDSYSLECAAFTRYSTETSALERQTTSIESRSESFTESGAIPDQEAMTFVNESTWEQWYGTLTYNRWGNDESTVSNVGTYTSDDFSTESFSQYGAFSPAGYSFSSVVRQEHASQTISNQQSGEQSTTSTGGESYTSSGSSNLACVPMGAEASGSHGYLNTGESNFSRSNYLSFTFGENSEMDYTAREEGEQYFPDAMSSAVYEGTTTSAYTNVQYQFSSETATESDTYSQFSYQSGTYPFETYQEVGETSFSTESSVNSSLTKNSSETLTETGSAISNWRQAGTFGGETYQFGSLESEVSGTSETDIARWSFQSHTSTGTSQSVTFSNLTHTSVQSTSLESEPGTAWQSWTESIATATSGFAESGSDSQTLSDTVSVAYAGYEQGSRLNGVLSLASVAFWQSTGHDFALDQDIEQSTSGFDNLASVTAQTTYTEWSAWEDGGSTSLYTGSSGRESSRDQTSVETFLKTQAISRQESGTDLESYTQQGTAPGGVYNYPYVVKEGHNEGSANFTVGGLFSFTRVSTDNESWTSTEANHSATAGSSAAHSGTLASIETIAGLETMAVTEATGGYLDYEQEGVYSGGSYSYASVTFGRGEYHTSAQFVDSQLDVAGQETSSLGTSIQRAIPEYSTTGYYEKNTDSNESELSNYTNSSSRTQSVANFESYSLARQEYSGFFSYVFASERAGTGSLSQMNEISSLATVTRNKTADGSWVQYSMPTGTFSLNNTETFTSSREETSGVEQFALDSYSLFQQGGVSSGCSTDDSLSSIQLNRYAVEQMVTDTSLTVIKTGQSNQTVSLYRPTGGTFTQDGNRDTHSQDSFSQGMTELQSQEAMVGVTVHAEGSYTNGTLSLSSFVQDSESNQYAWLSRETVQRSTQTVTATQSGSLAKVSDDTNQLSYSNQQDSVSTVGVEAESQLTYTDHQEGTFAGGALNLSSFSFDLEAEGYQLSTEDRTGTTTSNGTQSGLFVLGNFLEQYNGTGCFSLDSDETYSLSETRTFSLLRHGEGSGNVNALSMSSLSLWAVSEQDREITDKREALSRFTGVDGSSTSFSSSEETGLDIEAREWANSTLSEWGTYTQGGGLSMSYTMSLEGQSQVTASKSDVMAWGGGSTGSDDFSANAWALSTLNLWAEGRYGSGYHEGDFELTGGSIGTMNREESGTWGSGGGFTHNRYYNATQSVNKAGTFESGAVDFSTYWTDSLTTVTGTDAAQNYSTTFVNTTRTWVDSEGDTGVQTYFSTGALTTNAGGTVTSSNSSSTLTSSLSLTFAVDNLKPSGPLAGLSGLSSMSLIGGVPLLGNFAETPEIPLAGPAWTFETPVQGGDEGWWLELASGDEMGPGRWPQVRFSEETPESTSIHSVVNYEPSTSHWTWLGESAASNFLSQSNTAYQGAWSEFVSAAPSSDPYFLGARNPQVERPENPWEGDFLTAFDNWLMARIRNEAMGGTNLPLMAGDLPIYGPNGARATDVIPPEFGAVINAYANATIESIEITGAAIRTVLTVAQFLPVVGPYARAILVGIDVLQGNWVDAALTAGSHSLLGGVNAIARLRRVSEMSRAARLAINFTTGAIVHAGTDVVRQHLAIARGEQREYSVQQTLIAGALGGATNALFANTCFTGEMPLRVKGGSKRADEIREGDLLLSQDEFDPNGPVEERAVEEVFVRVSPVLNVHVGGQVIRTTGEHPFFVVDKGWLAAKFLQIGDLLQTEDKRFLPVEGVADSGEVETVYNFRIAEYHTYFVGSEAWGFSIWAHNANRNYLVGDHGNINSSFRRGRAHRNGREAHHLNQHAAYGNAASVPGATGTPIPYSRGAAVALQGSTATANSQHNRVHRGLEGFWNQARTTFATTGVAPTNAQYGTALYQSLRQSGYTAREAHRLADSARRQRISFGHLDGHPVPNIPNPFPPRFLP